MAKVLLVEDHTLVREMLAQLIGSMDHFEVVGQASDGLDGVRQAQELDPDLVIMDLVMPRLNGLEAIRRIRRQASGTAVLLLTAYATREVVRQALAAGAAGVLDKLTSSDELKLAIEKIEQGHPCVSPSIGKDSDEALWALPSSLGEGYAQLSQRERQVLRLVGRRLTNKEIATHLFLSPKTVERHKANSIKKLHLRNSSDLLSYIALHTVLFPNAIYAEADES